VVISVMLESADQNRRKIARLRKFSPPFNHKIDKRLLRIAIGGLTGIDDE